MPVDRPPPTAHRQAFAASWERALKAARVGLAKRV